jgi:6-phosphogluconolactonase
MTRPVRWIAACLAAAASFVTPTARAQQAGAAAQPSAAGGPPPAGEVRVYFGTYTGKSGSKGIYVSTLDLATGKLSPPELAGETTNPSFLAIHPGKRFLYAVGEVNEINGKKAGAVSAFAIGPTEARAAEPAAVRRAGAVLRRGRPRGQERPRGQLRQRGGRRACRSGRTGTGRAVEPPIQHEGKSVDPKRQAGPARPLDQPRPGEPVRVRGRPGARQGAGLPVRRRGRARWRRTTRRPAPSRPGRARGTSAFHPTGRFAYVINEMASTITAFAYDAARAR